MSSPRRHRVRWSILVSYVLLLLGSITVIGPFFWMITSAFKIPEQIGAIPPVWIPDPWTLNNIKTVLSRIDVPRMYFNSLFLATVTTVIQVYGSALVGHVLVKYQFSRRDLIFGAILGAMMVPWPVTLVPMYQLMVKLGLVNSYGGIILPALYSSFGIFMMRQYMYSIPTELIDAARIDGCGDWQVFNRVVLPNVGPAVSALAIFSFMWQWDSFLWPLIILMRDELYTLPIGMAAFAGAWYTDTGATLAAISLGVLPTLIVFLLFQRRIVEGVTLSGLKG